MNNKRQEFRRHDDYINHFCRSAFISSILALAFILIMIASLPKCGLSEILTKTIPFEIKKTVFTYDQQQAIKRKCYKADSEKI